MQLSKVIKDDEFYTPIYEIDCELPYYKDDLKGKRVYLPCDSEESAFVQYFKENDVCGSLDYSSSDFRENGARFDAADVIVTNPPFSLFVPFMQMILDRGKDFIVIGPLTACARPLLAPKIVSGEIKFGVYNGHKDFITSRGVEDRAPIVWLTSFDHGIRRDVKKTPPPPKNLYARYDNIDAIEIPNLVFIKYDYDGNMGVPMTFLYKHSLREKFDIVQFPAKPTIGGKPTFPRVIIRRKGAPECKLGNLI